MPVGPKDLFNPVLVLIQEEEKHDHSDIKLVLKKKSDIKLLTLRKILYNNLKFTI